jgi:hypothetical protein
MMTAMLILGVLLSVHRQREERMLGGGPSA